MSGHNALHQQLDSDYVMLDPGTGNYLVVDRDRGMVELVTAAAETRKLADPDRSGLMLGITLKTDGGDCVVTADTALNVAGNTIMTFDTAGDTILLLSIPDGTTGYKWKIVGNDGVALS